MKFFELGKENPEIVVMLHGGGTYYAAQTPVAKRLAETYHVIQVAYDGFNPQEPETEFSTTRHEAKAIADYIVENYGGKIDILYAISYGCYVMLDVLADDRLNIVTTIADGMPAIDYPDIKSEWLKQIYLLFLTGIGYELIGKAGPVRQKIVCNLMGRNYENYDEIVYRKATWKSWKNQDYCMIGKHIDFKLFERTDLHIWHGGKGSAEKKLAKHMEEWKKAGYKFTYKLFPDYGHGGLIGEHTDQFIKEVNAAHTRSNL